MENQDERSTPWWAECRCALVTRTHQALLPVPPLTHHVSRLRQFESQDVLVPWHRPQPQSTPSLELTSTTTTSEEDLHPPYHAYTQTSDSDSCRSAR